MEGQLWEILYDALIPLGKRRPGKPGQVYSDALIVLVAFWACLHDRPRKWACDTHNWHGLPGGCPFLNLPRPGTLTRRLKTFGPLLLLTQLFDLLNSLVPAGMFKRIDGRPLPVGGASKDRDAKSGYGAGRISKGYKTHEIRSGGGHIDAWTLTPMRGSEPVVAVDLIGRLPAGGGGYLVGDNQYDSNALYAVAGAKEFQLLAPRRPTAKGKGHRKDSPFRARSLALQDNPLWCAGMPAGLGQALLGMRRGIEREFAHETTGPCGLAPLPPFVRRPRRTALWVACKLILDLLRTALRHHALELHGKIQELQRS